MRRRLPTTKPLDLDLGLRMESSSSSSESDEEEVRVSGSTRTSRPFSEAGLGINFYDHKGVKKREVVTKEEAEQVLHEAIALKVAASPSLSSVYSPPRLSSPGYSSGITLSGSSSGSPLFTIDSKFKLSTSSSPSPLFDLKSKSPLPLIDELLEENYRGQAESFVASAKRTLSGKRSVSSPLWTPSTATFDHPTPTRQSSRTSSSLVSKQRADPRSLNNFNRSRNSTPLNNENTIILESYRIPTKKATSDSPLESPNSPQKPGHCTYGYRILTVPTLSPRAHRDLWIYRRPYPTVAPDSQRRSKYLYFTARERQAIADLVHAKPLVCEHHSNCTDCLNLEFAFQENKVMPTSMPPDERQRIINNNRSLRNIKNVSIPPFSTALGRHIC
jgi:hypothetical protein